MNPLIRVAITLVVILSPLPKITAAVIDTNGDTVRNSGGSYYIIPYGIGGGLSPTKRLGSPPCPLYITRTGTSLGVPVRISSPLRILDILEGTRVSIDFVTNDTMTCDGSLGWGISNTGYVTVGTPDRFNNFFTIDKAGIMENTYKITTFCSSDEDSCDDHDLGFIKKNGLLGVTNGNPLIVQFKKASDPGEVLGNSIM